jgi:peptidoglycan L-alanyl-D-glutamate endopeptidase CwlK
MIFDERTERNLATLDPKAQERFRAFIEEAKEVARKENTQYVAIGGDRTWRQQDALYAIGRTKPGRIVTNAKGGQSNHNFGLALDFGVFRDGKYLDTAMPNLAAHVHKQVGKLAKKHGLEWGGAWQRFKDLPHFEVSTPFTLAQKRARFLKYGSVL